MAKRGVKPWVEENEPENRLPRPWMRVFLAKLAKVPNIAGRCRSRGTSYTVRYSWRDKSARFRKAWDEAIQIAVADLEEVVWNRARDPVNPSDLLAIFLLKAHKPEMYRETRRVEIGPSQDGPAVIELRAVDYRIAAAALAPPEDEMTEDADYRILPQIPERAGVGN